MNYTVDEYIKIAAEFLKGFGFRKSRQTWRKETTESILVFNIQRSEWDNSKFYINVGVYFRKLGNDVNPTENVCHVRTRISTDNLENSTTIAIDWLKARECLDDAKKLASHDSKHGLVYKELRH